MRFEQFSGLSLIFRLPDFQTSMIFRDWFELNIGESRKSLDVYLLYVTFLQELTCSLQGTLLLSKRNLDFSNFTILFLLLVTVCKFYSRIVSKKLLLFFCKQDLSLLTSGRRAFICLSTTTGIHFTRSRKFLFARSATTSVASEIYFLVLLIQIQIKNQIQTWISSSNLKSNPSLNFKFKFELKIKFKLEFQIQIQI